jgi:hypothetical protein
MPLAISMIHQANGEMLRIAVTSHVLLHGMFCLVLKALNSQEQSLQKLTHHSNSLQTIPTLLHLLMNVPTAQILTTCGSVNNLI